MFIDFLKEKMQMSEIKFFEEDVERTIAAANDIIKNDIITLLENDKQVKACLLLEKLILNLAICQDKMAHEIRRVDIADFFIEWKYQMKLLSQKMTEMKNEEVISELEIIMTITHENIGLQNSFVF